MAVYEIHQSAYNVDELVMETVLAIVKQIESTGKLSAELRRQWEDDRAICERWATDTQNDAVDSYPQDILEDWKTIANRFGIIVIEDGEAGWTYVGFAEDEFIMHYYDDFEE